MLTVLLARQVGRALGLPDDTARNLDMPEMWLCDEVDTNTVYSLRATR